ncbi:hypothetical protein EDB83DRAFT_2445491 [Lactarius deliciosus]|nr:hypothetical protein EDB83DRAFT_2445491 [Lactarius deliciosus]
MLLSIERTHLFPTSACVDSLLSSLLTICSHLVDQIMSFPTIQNVFACIIVICPLLTIFISLAHPHQSWRLSFDLWYFPLPFLWCI